MKLTFDEVMDAIIKGNPDWKAKREGNETVFTNEDSDCVDVYSFDEKLNQKICDKIDCACLLYRLKAYQDNELVSDRYSLIIRHTGEFKRIGCITSYDGDTIEPDIFVDILDEFYKTENPDEDAVLSLSKEIKLLVDEVKNLNEFRLRYLYI